MNKSSNLIVQLAVQTKNGIMKHVNVSVKIIIRTKKTFTASFYQKVRYNMDFYILHISLLVIILQLIIANICYHYAKLA